MGPPGPPAALEGPFAPILADDGASDPQETWQCVPRNRASWQPGCRIARLGRVELDDIDRRLIALLRADARRPASSLAAALGVSRGTVQNRIGRLLRGGVIQGFTLRLGPEAEAVGSAVRAVTAIEIRGRTASGVLRALRGFPEVRALHMTNGRWDVIAELAAGSLEALDQALNRIRMLEGVANTETSILLSTQKG
jgi:DNA-binding Lrp family transcriptional regulator